MRSGLLPSRTIGTAIAAIPLATFTVVSGLISPRARRPKRKQDQTIAAGATGISFLAEPTPA
jgi:hypothetical protein